METSTLETSDQSSRNDEQGKRPPGRCTYGGHYSSGQSGRHSASEQVRRREREGERERHRRRAVL